MSPTALRLDQTVVAITPDNGGYVEAVPADVVLTYVRDVEGEPAATVTLPDGEQQPAQARVEGTEVLVAVPDEGPGDYTVEVVVDDRTSATAFTVLGQGESAPVEEASYGPLLLGGVLVAFALVAVLTLRRLMGRR